MASFYCTLSPVDGDGTQLSVYAKFTGGSDDYTFKRLIDVRITGVGTFEFNSTAVGGGESTFVGTITGLSPGTTYEWVCNLYYWGGDWIVSDYSDEGTVTTYSGGGGSGGSAKAVVNVGTYPIRTGRDTAQSSTLGHITTQIGYRFDRSTITGAIRNPIGGKEHE